MAHKLKMRVMKAVPWMLADSFLIAVSGIGSSLLMAWLLTPTQLGQAAIALGIMGLASIVTSFGIEESLVRHPSAHTSLTDSAFIGLFGFAVLGILACSGTAYFVADMYADPDLPLMIIVASFLLLTDAAAIVPTAVLTRKMRAKMMTRRLMTAKLILLPATGLLAYAGLGAWAIIGAQFIANIFSNVSLWMAMPRRPRLRFVWSEFWPLVSFGASITLQKLLAMGSMRLFALLVGYFHGVPALGYFNFAQRLVGQIANLIQGNIVRYGLSLFSGLERTAQELSKPFLTATSLITAVGAPVFVGLALVAPDLVPLVFGKKWMPAVPVIQVFAGVWFLTLSRALIGPLLRAKGHPNAALPSLIVSTIVMLVAGVLSAGYGLVAAALAWATRVVIGIPWSFHLGRRYGGASIRTQLISAIRPLGPTAAMAALVLLAQHLLVDAPAVSRLAISVAVGIAAYGAFLPLLSRETVRTGRQMVRMFRTARKRA